MFISVFLIPGPLLKTAFPYGNPGIVCNRFLKYDTLPGIE